MFWPDLDGVPGDPEQLSDSQVLLDLLKPWLRSRGPCPLSWWTATLGLWVLFGVIIHMRQNLHQLPAAALFAHN